MENNWFNSLMPYIPSVATTGLQQLSYLSNNSPDKAMRDYYMNMSSYESQNKDLYSTDQDLYGKSYFEDGGSYEDISNEYNQISKLQDMASMDGDNELYEYLTPKVKSLQTSLSSLEDLAKFDAMREDLQRQIIQPQPTEMSIDPYNSRRPYTTDNVDMEYNNSTSMTPEYMSGFKPLKGTPQNVKRYLTQKGLSPNAVAGIMGNIEHESSFNPGISGDQGTSFGLFQHHAARKNNLLSYLKKRNLPSTNIEGQIDFALSEYPQLVKKLNKATSPQQAADIWIREFERPANVEKQSKLRQKSALKYMQQGGTAQNPPKIYTDPVLYNRAAQNYNDSLSAYNYGENLYRFTKKVYNDVRHPRNKKFRENYNIKNTTTKPVPFRNTNIYPIENYTETYVRKPGSFFEKTFSDNRPNYYISDDGKKYEPTGTGWQRYKMPVQPVKYQPQQKTNAQKSKITSNKELLNLKLPSGDVPRYANGQPVYTKPQTINTSKGKVLSTVKPDQVKGTQLVNITEQVNRPTHPITNMKRLSMSPQYLDNPNIQIQGQLIPVPEIRLPQKGNIPFYGPGNTIIGYTDANRYFYPAQQYTGAVNNQINLQDKELLNNPELLKKYVQSKDTYKFQLGGYTFPQYNYQQVRILPFLKKYK